VSRSVDAQLGFCRLGELLQQGLVLEPNLQAIANFLDDHMVMIDPLRRNLRLVLRNPDTGRRH
jgi:hypothetical protein